MDRQAIFDQIKGGLIVSCQALEHEPLYTKEGGIMPLMAKAAAQSGAVGIRANTVRDITQIKEAVDLPVIGIIKKDYEGTPMYITVTMKEVDELVACGVDILAVQGTSALRPDGSTAAQFIEAIKAKYPEQLVMADCATIGEGIACANAGADFVGTTMRGYTPETQGCDDIDFDFIHELSEKCPAKIIAEGHIHYPEQAKKALEEAEYGSLATISEDGTPYITPLNFVYTDGALYFHCAKDVGHKLDNIARNHNACFSIVDSVELMPEKFATKYRSVTVFGTVDVVKDAAEKRSAIEALALKISPDYREAGLEYINAAIDKISMLRFKIDHMTGKASK